MMGRGLRAPNTGMLLLVVFGGFELAQAVGNHQPSLAFGTWLAFSAAGSMALRLPNTRARLAARSRNGLALLAVEVSWAALLAATAFVTLSGIDRNDYVWAIAAAVGLVLTPLALRGLPLTPGQPGPGSS